jgi:hypothetical protein
MSDMPFSSSFRATKTSARVSDKLKHIGQQNHFLITGDSKGIKYAVYDKKMSIILK